MFPTNKIITAIIFTIFGVTEAGAFGQNSLNENTATPQAMYDVSIENLTANQPLTPPVITIGNKELFKEGQPSSNALALLAEDGVQSGFKDLNLDFVHLGEKGIEPGKTRTYRFLAPIVSRHNDNKLSVVSMLARTNDAFIGLNQVGFATGFGISLLPGGSNTFNAYVYDAGSEANTESCRDIPAPPCNSHFAKPNRPGEGAVRKHPGLKLTTGDLVHSDLFPMVGAKITVTRIL